MRTYMVTFARIGRNHGVAPLVAEVDGSNHLAEKIYHYARPHLRSRDVEVDLDLEAGKGSIFCGVQSGGTFTVTEVPS